MRSVIQTLQNANVHLVVSSNFDGMSKTYECDILSDVGIQFNFEWDHDVHGPLRFTLNFPKSLI